MNFENVTIYEISEPLAVPQGQVTRLPLNLAHGDCEQPVDGVMLVDELAYNGTYFQCAVFFKNPENHRIRVVVFGADSVGKSFLFDVLSYNDTVVIPIQFTPNIRQMWIEVECKTGDIGITEAHAIVSRFGPFAENLQPPPQHEQPPENR